MRSIVLMLCIFAICLCVQSLPQSSDKVEVSLSMKGSTPPIPKLYECVRQLDGRPYDEAKTRDCMSSMLSTGYFEKGEDRLVQEGSHRVLHFELKSRTLTLAEINFHLPGDDVNEFNHWLEKGGDTIQPGSPYDQTRQFATARQIEQFFGSLGRSAVVSTSTRLDYVQGTAKIEYDVVEGPLISKRPLPPPYGKEISNPVTAFNWSAIDDYVPLSLVESLISIKPPWAPFSKELLKKDIEALRKTNLFEKVEYSRLDKHGQKQVSLSIRSNPIVIRSLTIKGYGEIVDRGLSYVSELPLKEGGFYSRKLAKEADEYLRNSLQKSGLKLRIIEQAVPTPDHKLNVIFHILSGNKDSLMINGNKIPADWD